MKAPNLHQ